MLGASAKARSSGRKIAGDLEEKGNCSSDRNKQFRMLSKNNYWAKTVVVNISPAPEGYCRQLHQCRALLVQSTGRSTAVGWWRQLPKGIHPAGHGILLPVFPLHLPHKPSWRCLIFCFRFWLQKVMLKAARFPSVPKGRYGSVRPLRH